MRVSSDVDTESVVIWPLESAETTRRTFNRGAWPSRYEPRKLGFAACVASAEIRNEFAYVWGRILALLAFANDSAILSIVPGKKLPRAPCRRRERISSSSKTPTSFTMPSSSDVGADAEARRPSIADEEHRLSSILPTKMNSLSNPPTCGGCVSKSSSSKLTIKE